jgi:hypothetical protein
MAARVFLLSPARLDGIRAQALVRCARAAGVGEAEREDARGLAAALASREGAPIGEVFRSLSGLYFRGKLAYATRFGAAFVITANRGLLPVETRICVQHLEAFSETKIDPAERSFRVPLVRDAELLKGTLGPEGDVVLLGSVAQAKYTAPLLDVFGDRLLFPKEFVGRGDMSRGGLLLRAAEAGAELAYLPVRGAELRGRRPPKLEPRGGRERR